MKKIHLLWLLILFALSSCQRSNSVDEAENKAGRQPVFVGRENCKECHLQQYNQFIGSDHDRAMDAATDSTVLGNFNDVYFEHLGVRSHFFKKSGEFFVNTKGPDGGMQNFKVRYVFGFQPLQQYVIEFPNGRYQMLPLCWDTRSAKDGGQRWFHIYGEERIAPNDILYWTRMAQNWNYMCSECHSTNVRKNYDQDRGAYATTWSEIDVSCEACHGPGSEHAAWARAAEKGQSLTVAGYLGLTVRLNDVDNATWVLRDVQKGTAERTAPRTNRTLVDMCGRCHSRRSILSEDYRYGKSLLDTHQPSVLQQGLYFADGQIQDEVYVYGSFLQSKMYNAGVACSDCHEPHSGKTYAQGNALCYRCHAPSKFGVRTHHHHDPEKTGGLCIDCHMPERTYMVVDPRRDHSMRIPRPDLSDKLETPNACTNCHNDKSNQWAVDYFQEWYGEKKERHYGETFYAARRGYPDAKDELIRLADSTGNAPMIRAAALSLLAQYPSEQSLHALKTAINDPDPLVRASVIASADMADVSTRFQLFKPLLQDSVRLVRVQAAQSLADTPAEMMTGGEAVQLAGALLEYKHTLYINADHQTAWLNLAILALRQKDYQTAEEYYIKAINVEPLFPYSYINLADLYRMQGRENEGEETLLRALKQSPDMAEVHHALGLLYVRQKKIDKALLHLQKAAELNPGAARFAYVYAIALNSTGDTPGAFTVLQQALARHPYDRDLLTALVGINRDQGLLRRALVFADRLAEDDAQEFGPMAAQLRRMIAEKDSVGDNPGDNFSRGEVTR